MRKACNQALSSMCALGPPYTGHEASWGTAWHGLVAKLRPFNKSFLRSVLCSFSSQTQLDSFQKWEKKRTGIGNTTSRRFFRHENHQATPQPRHRENRLPSPERNARARRCPSDNSNSMSTLPQDSSPTSSKPRLRELQGGRSYKAVRYERSGQKLL